MNKEITLLPRGKAGGMNNGQMPPVRRSGANSTNSQFLGVKCEKGAIS